MPPNQKMKRVIHNTQPLNCVGREEREMVAWITPNIPQGVFNTTNRIAYSPEEDVEDEDENREADSRQDEEDDDLVFMGEHAQQDHDEDDDEEQIIIVMK